MIRGWNTAISGMRAQEVRMNAISNNLANVDLNGYKRDISVFKNFPEMLITRFNDQVVRFPIGSVDNAPMVGKLGTGVEYNESFTDFSQGSVKETEHVYDIALDGPGFFAIETPQGERYTRNGAFILGKEGFLETKEGYRVLGENGPLSLKLHNFRIDEEGRIFTNPLYDEEGRLVGSDENDWENYELHDTLKIVRFDKPRFLEKQGNSFWKPRIEGGDNLSGDPEVSTPENRPRVLWRFLETANVNPVTEMVSMIEVQRAYEANQKVVQTHDSMLNTLFNNAARYA